MARLIKIDKNGSKHYEGMITCDRCGGQGGSSAWDYTGYTCYKCGGEGKVFAKWIERTPEYEAKLAERRRKRMEAKAAEIEAQMAEIKAKQEAERKRKESEEAEIKAQKAISQYVGKIGEKISVDVTYDHTAHYDFRMGWMEQRMFIHTFKDAAGNVLVWKTTSNSLYECEEGQQYKLTGTVKEQSEYKEEKQTILTRCKIK